MKSRSLYYIVMWMLCCTSLLYEEVELKSTSSTVVISEGGNAWYQDWLILFTQLYIHVIIQNLMLLSACLSVEVCCVYLTSRSALVGQGISYTTKIVMCLFIIITVFHCYVFFLITGLLLLP